MESSSSSGNGLLIDIHRRTAVLLIDMLQNLRCHILAVAVCHFMPVEMIQSGELISQLLFSLADIARLPHLRDGRHVTQTDGLLPAKFFDGRLSHHTAGIRKIDQPGIRTQLPHIVDNLSDNRNSPEGLEDTACAVGLLPQHSVQIRDTLILNPSLQKPHTELCGHKIRPRKRFPRSSVVCTFT